MQASASSNMEEPVSDDMLRGWFLRQGTRHHREEMVDKKLNLKATAEIPIIQRSCAISVALEQRFPLVLPI